jgi:hypothetical protein
VADRLALLPTRIAAKIRVDESGCWIWTGSGCGDPSKQYGHAWDGERQRVAHRVVYAILVGPIPKGLTLDHLCRVRRCVNPEHVELVTQRENTLRGEGPAAQKARQTHCKRGHEFTEANTYRSRKGRECRTCNRARKAATYQRQKAAA